MVLPDLLFFYHIFQKSHLNNEEKEEEEEEQEEENQELVRANHGLTSPMAPENSLQPSARRVGRKGQIAPFLRFRGAVSRLAA